MISGLNTNISSTPTISEPEKRRRVAGAGVTAIWAMIFPAAF
jgi:hypothetical protein